MIIQLASGNAIEHFIQLELEKHLLSFPLQEFDHVCCGNVSETSFMTLHF